MLFLAIISFLLFSSVLVHNTFTGLSSCTYKMIRFELSHWPCKNLAFVLCNIILKECLAYTCTVTYHLQNGIYLFSWYCNPMIRVASIKLCNV